MTNLRSRLVPFSIVLVMLPVAAAAADAVMPDVFWDAQEKAVFVSPPAAVAAWMAGEAADLDGALEAMAVAYERQRRSPGFAAAILELREIVASAEATGEYAPTEINLRLIPAVLHARDDLRGALLAAESDYPTDPGDCWEEVAGKIECNEWWGIFCYKVACRANPANTCTIFLPCQSGHAVAGTGQGMRSKLN